MKLIWKLLRQNINKTQLIGFAIANLIGMTIVLLAIQFYFDLNPVFNSKEDNLFKKDYFVVTKKLGLLSMISSNSSNASGFSPKELDEMKQAGFIKDVGSFNSSQFSVNAAFNYPSRGIHFNTDMFFESVPMNFIDVKTEDWTFSPLDNSIPIILPKNYLDLYNFGFAESRGMPKISENIIKMLSLDIRISGQGKTRDLKGRIVGFSNRLNTVLVPESFMTWANENYGNSENRDPSRVIVEAKDITDPQIASFFKDRGYDIGNNNTIASRMAFFLKLIIGIVVAVGLIICTLSFFILTLSIYLLIEKNMEKLNNLRLIGYSKSTVCKPYTFLSIGINAVTLILSLVVVLIVKQNYVGVMERVWSEFESQNILNTILIGFGIFTLLSLINVWIIRNKVR